MSIELASAYVSLTTSAKGLRREISSEFDDVQRDADKAGSDAGASFADGFGVKLAAFGATAGLALGAALTKGTLDALDQEAANDRLAAQLGLDPVESARLGGVAGDLYAGAYGESLEQVNETIRGVYQELGGQDIPTDQLEGLTAAALDLSTAFGQDVNQTIAAASALLSTGLAPDATAAFDVITAGFQAVGPRGDDLLETFTEYSNQFADFGLEAEQAMSLLASGLEGGARSTDGVADSLKELGLRVTEGTDPARDAIAELGLDIEDIQALFNEDRGAQAFNDVFTALSEVEDQSDAARLAQTLLGGTYEQVGLQGIEAMAGLTAGVGETGGATEALGDTLNDNLSVRLESLKRTGLQALADIASATVVPALEAIVGVVGELTTAFGEDGWSGVLDVIMEKLSPVTDWAEENQTLLTVIAGVIAGAVVAAFIAWAVSAGAAAVATVAAAAPFLLVAAAVGALVGILVYAYNNSEQFRDVVDRVATLVREKVIPAVIEFAGWLADNLGPALQWIWEVIETYVLPAIVTLIEESINLAADIGQVASDIIGFFTDVVDFVGGLAGDIRDAASNMWDGISDPFLDMIDVIKSAWNNTLGGFGVDVPGFLGFGGFSFTIPSLHTGGLVPGGAADEHLYVLQGGERVLSRAQTAEYDAGAGGGSQGGIHIGAIHLSDRPILEQLNELHLLRPAAA